MNLLYHNCLCLQSVTRAFNRFVNYVLKGFFGTSFYVLVLPPLFLFCSLLSVMLAIASPLYVLAFSAVTHLLAFACFDFEGKNSLYKITNCLKFNVSIKILVAQQIHYHISNLLGASPLTAVTWNVLINILVEGIFQPLCAATVAFIACPIGAFIIAIGAFIRKGFRDSWDSILFQVI